MTSPTYPRAAELGRLLDDAGIDAQAFASVIGYLPERVDAFMRGEDRGVWFYLFEGKGKLVVDILSIGGHEITVHDLWRWRDEDATVVVKATKPEDETKR